MRAKRPKMEAIQDVIAMCTELAHGTIGCLDVDRDGYTAVDAVKYGVKAGKCELAREILNLLDGVA